MTTHTSFDDTRVYKEGKGNMLRQMQIGFTNSYTNLTPLERLMRTRNPESNQFGSSDATSIDCNTVRPSVITNLPPQVFAIFTVNKPKVEWYLWS